MNVLIQLKKTTPLRFCRACAWLPRALASRPSGATAKT